MLALSVLLTGLLVLIGCMVVFGLIDNFRELRILSRLRCPHCHASYGPAKARRSKEQHKSECAEEVRQILAEAEAAGEGVEIDIFSHEWQVECSHCGHRMTYDACKKKLFALVEAE